MKSEDKLQEKMKDPNIAYYLKIFYRLVGKKYNKNLAKIKKLLYNQNINKK